MRVRPQERIRAPKLKALLFLFALAAGTVLGVAAAEERTARVAVATKAVRAFTPVGAADVELRDVTKGAAKDAAKAVGDVVGRIALTDVPMGKPVRKANAVAAPTCGSLETVTFGVVVVPLRAPVPSPIKKDAHIQLRSSSDDGIPSPRAVFVNAVEPPKTASSDAVAVAYAEVVVALADAPDLARATAWTMVPAPPC